VINGGFGLLLDGSGEADRKLENMLYFDVNNGIARRAWAGNKNAVSAITREAHRTFVTKTNQTDDRLLDLIIQ
jgi:urocanate hydratase